MIACAAAGAGFLVAVLWFDLMFDVQVRRLPDEAQRTAVLASIGAYYRRVTTAATPMNRLITVVMALTLAAIVAEIVTGSAPRWLAWPSLAAALTGIGFAAVRTVRNAVRLGRGADPIETQAGLALSIWRDHLVCLTAMSVVVALQLAAAFGRSMA